MSFTGNPLVLDEWLDVGGGKVCNLTAAKAFSSQPIGEGAGAPPELDSVFAWYKADAQSFANGALADPILDSSGNGNHLNTHGNPPASQEPHFFTNVVNGLPVFRWGGTDTFFRNIAAINPPGVSYAMVTRRNSLNGVQSGAYIMPMQTAAFQYGTRSFDSGASSLRFQAEAAGSGGVVSLTVPLGTWQIFTYTMDDTEGIARIKTNDQSASGAVSAGSENVIRTRMQYFSDGEIAEVICWAKKLSDSSLHDARAYLSSKYAIPVL